ncbi:MAG: hypothetical protein KDK36_04480 [Leptospiraceae bacterium]|nr:hypothetical protein [Leptospiraceae bacterium]
MPRKKKRSKRKTSSPSCSITKTRKKTTTRKKVGEVLSRPKRPKTNSEKAWNDYEKKVKKYVENQKKIKSIKKRTQNRLDNLSGARETSSSIFGW